MQKEIGAMQTQLKWPHCVAEANLTEVRTAF